MPLGGNTITRDITSLQMEEQDAEKLKLQYGNALYEEEEESETPAVCALEDGRAIELATLNNIIGARSEEILANVWNWDELWRVEWMEDGKVMGKMTHYTGYDPLAAKICADKSIVEYDWINPIHTRHMFRATPKNPKAKLEVKVTDRFGNVYTQEVK